MSDWDREYKGWQEQLGHQFMGAHSMFYLHLVELSHHTESSTILNYHMDVRGRAFVGKSVKDYVEVRHPSSGIASKQGQAESRRKPLIRERSLPFCIELRELSRLCELQPEATWSSNTFLFIHIKYYLEIPIPCGIG